jgi:hypothetical protein
MSATTPRSSVAPFLRAPTRRQTGWICVIAGGCLLAAAGALLAYHRVHSVPKARSDVQAGLAAALNGPLVALEVEVRGPDPFRSRSADGVLRLRARATAGAPLDSDVPLNRMLPRSGSRAPTTKAWGVYVIPWPAVVQGASTAADRAVALSTVRLADLGRFEHLGVAIVTAGASGSAVPDSLRIVSNTEPPLELVHAVRACRELGDPSGRSVWGYQDEEPYISFTERLTGWKARSGFWLAHPSSRPILLGLLLAGGLPLAAGFRLLEVGRNVVFTLLAKTRRARATAGGLLVWGVSAILLVTSLGYVARYARNAPYCDDWAYIAYVTGDRPITAGYLWEQEGEHRHVLTRVIALGLIKLSGIEFRASTYFRTVALGGMAVALVLVARRQRGKTSFSDAFFPLLLQQWGFPECLVSAWVFVARLAPTLIATPVLIIAATRGTRLTIGTAMAAGFFVALLPLCSAAGLLYVPALLVWLGVSAVVAWRSGARRDKATSLFIIAWMLVVAVIALLYFQGYDRRVSQAYAPPGRDIPSILSTILAVMSSGLGLTARRYWPYSGLAMLMLSLASVATLIRHAGGDQPATTRSRARGLLCAWGGALSLAAGLGWGRAGFGHLHAFSYATLALWIPCLGYLAWGIDRSPRRRYLVQAGLFVWLGLSAFQNIPAWVAEGKADHAARTAFERDLSAGVPSHLLIARHHRALGLTDCSIELGQDGMRMLKRSRVGTFDRLCADSPLRAVPVPLTLSELGDAELERGLVVSARDRSFLTFTVSEPTYAAAIRFQCGAPSSAGPFLFGVSWKGSRDPIVPEARAFLSGFPEKPFTIAVGDTIDKLRIYPNMRSAHGSGSSRFHLEKIEILVPAEERPRLGTAHPSHAPSDRVLHSG